MRTARWTCDFTVPIGLALFIGSHTTAWGPLFAASVVATVPNVVAYEIQVRTQAGASYAVPQLDAPGITSSGSAPPQTVGLSSDQPGAAIYFTLDGSQPAPRGPTSMLYTSPFVVSEPCLLRTRAWLAGFVASAEARASFG